MFIESQFILQKDLGCPFLLQELARVPRRHDATESSIQLLQ